MRRSSLVGPVLLIALGLVFLVNNLYPEIPLLGLLGSYWPYLLIAWGGLRLIEVLYWHFAGKPLPRSGLSGGEWTLIVLIALIGGGIQASNRFRDHWPGARITMHGVELFGESFDFPLSASYEGAGKAPRVVIDNLRGNARVITADTENIAVSGRATVRALDQGSAEGVNERCPLEIVKQGDLIVVRTNQERAAEASRISSELDITVPRGASVEGRGRYGDFEITGIAGSVEIDSANAGVRLADIGGNVRVSLGKSDVVRAVNVAGNVDMKGSGWDVDLENIQGTTTINGSYSGEVRLRRLAKALRFQNRSNELRLERVPGQLRMTRSDLNGEDLVGPVVLRARNQDVILANFTETLELNVERGDVQVRPRAPLAKIDVRTNAGDIDFAVPAGAKFQLRATTSRGEIVDDFGAPLEGRREGRGQVLMGSVGGGPEVSLVSERGTIRLYKAGAEPPRPPTPPAVSVPKTPVPSLTVQEQ
jgi:hypothetical protein